MATPSTFIRFVVPGRIDPQSEATVGVVSIAYELLCSEDVRLEWRAELKLRLRWVEQNLAVPSRFNRTCSKGSYRRKARGLSWLRAECSEPIDAMRALSDAVAACGFEVTQVCETRIGFVVYEDAFQAVAEPFRDTRTK